MKVRFSDVFDAYDGELPEISAAEVISSKRVKKLVEKKLRAGTQTHMKLWRTALIAAAVVVLLIFSAFAVRFAVIRSGSQAVSVCNRELGVLQKAGIITADFQINGSTSHIRLLNDGDLSGVFSRSFEPFYLIQFSTGKYFGNVCVNTATGKITQLNIGAAPQSGDVPVRASGSLSWYDNFDDIFDVSMTVDGMCQKLCDYWGFDGYTIVSGDGSALLTAMNENWQHTLTTVAFDGDQSGAEQYIETDIFCSGANLMIGFAHGQG